MTHVKLGVALGLVLEGRVGGHAAGRGGEGPAGEGLARESGAAGNHGGHGVGCGVYKIVARSFEVLFEVVV